ncbi:MAG TPA: hypothetical protein VK540_34520 [Polyangiaceae bacterium]|nr:hypothetical protein [Polyangiaceae bacterium]
MSPELEPPTHLAPLLDEMDACIAPHTGQRFFWFSVPPRHWKTTTLRHGIAKHLQRWPDESAAYVSHTQPFANKQSRYLRKLAARCGFRFSLDANRQDEWELRDYDGGVTARGVQGFGAGLGFRLIVLDDLIKTRKEAESPTYRQQVWDAIEDDILPRLTPDGCVWLVHTRWHEDDPIGRAKKQGWRGVNLKALGGEAEDQPLLRKHWDFGVLDAIRKKNARKFASLYQGMPRPKGGAVFQAPTLYNWKTERPTSGFRRAYGIDLAYSEKTVARADWSVSLEMNRVENAKDPKKPLFYVVEMERKQVDAPSFTLTLHAQQTKRPGPMRWYASGTEKGAGQFVKKKVPQLKIKNATSDKYVRATPFSEAWNEGRVLVPDGEDKPEWVDVLVEEITTFTGVKDASDDIVDAGAAGFDELNRDPIDLSVEGYRSER